MYEGKTEIRKKEGQIYQGMRWERKFIKVRLIYMEQNAGYTKLKYGVRPMGI